MSARLAADWYARARLDLKKARRAQDVGNLDERDRCVADARQARDRARNARSGTASRRRLVADVSEVHARAVTVVNLLGACREELSRLEVIPTGDADDVNALTAGRGFVERAQAILARRFAA